MAECWKPEEDLSDDLALRIVGVLDRPATYASYNRVAGIISTWHIKNEPVNQLTKHEALDKLLDIATTITEVLDDAHLAVDKAEIVGLMRSALDAGDPPDAIDYGLIAVTVEDLESAARDMKLGPNEKAALLRRRDQISWAVANVIMTEKFMPVVAAESRKVLTEIARLN